ncbi:MAG TPA: tetratricopeptide repeat protein [Candidatus Paceibacterota bacterium]|nr:tetratricopeptide repeat protein [Candidatus Paceibacterota bacterium]
MNKSIVDEKSAASDSQQEKIFVPRELSTMEKISFWILMACSFLLPIFVYEPFSGFTPDFSKKAVLFCGAILSFLFWILARFEDGKISIPGGLFIKGSAALLAAFVASSFAAGETGRSFYNSVFGSSFDTDTLSVFLAAFSLMFLSSIYFQSIKRLSYFYTALFFSFLIVFVAEAAHLYMGGTLIPGQGAVANLIGKWDDLGIFFGLCAAMSLAAIELMHLNLNSKIFVWFVLLASLFSVAVVNYSAIWMILGVTSLLILVYAIFYNGNKTSVGSPMSNIWSRPSFFIILICAALSFNMSGFSLLWNPQTKISETLSKYNIVNMDVRPSLETTLDVAKNTYKDGWTKTLFGVGPNNFSGQWLKFKPTVVNDTIFWNVDFNMGIGRIPSYFITLGLLGVLAWIFFLGSIFYLGFKTVLYSDIPKSSRFIVFVSLSSAIYLWLFSLVYVPDTVIFALSFIVTGVLVSSLVRAHAIQNIEFSFLKDPRLGFVSVLILVVLVVSGVSGGYSVYNKFLSNYFYQRSLSTLNSSGDFDKALADVKLALERDAQDTYYRSISEINLAKLNKFISEKRTMDKESVTLVQQIIVNASAAARDAIKLNDSNYLNWIALGRVGEAVIPLGSVIDGSYELASDSYKKALELNPKNPTILLNLARLEIANKNVKQAKEYLGKALELKSNFTAALYLLSQIEASEGNLAGAISKAERAYLFAPDDLGVLFQLGFLKFTSKDYEGAITALERAESINPQYSNAKYFLGLSYAKVGENSKALKEFRDISALNPENEEIKSIINNLLQGKDPFAAAVSAKTGATKKGGLPVKEVE